jgi:23S rRNA (cytosine1962-C5)-methyltransferase
MVQKTNFPILVLKPEREKSIINRHPWIFSGAVATLPEVDNGAVIEVQDSKKRILGYGFFDPQSQIVCRLFEIGKDPIAPSYAYWSAKIESAYLLRQKYILNTTTNAFRLLHAEGDMLPGIIADVYGEVVVLQLLIRGTELLADTFVRILADKGFRYIYLKAKDTSKTLEGLQTQAGWLTAPYPRELIASENGLLFPIDVEKGQKTGFFLDQRENRAMIKQYARSKTVLNAFSYTGGFSVYALAGGAALVHSVDISKDAIAICKKAVEMNLSNQNQHEAYSEDCFEFLKNSKEQYDIVVLDPPAFAKNKKAVANASRGYISLNELGLKRVKSGGLLFTFSCSGNIDRELFRKIIFTACAETRRNVRILHQLSQPIDHPINIYHPEGEYLKGLVLYVE